MSLLDPRPWLCRSCACIAGEPYRYPDTPWAYCSRAGCAMSTDEQLVALERLRFDAGVPAPTGAPSPPVSVQSAVAARPLMTVAEVGTFFGRTTQAVYKMIQRGQVAGATRVGRRLYVRRAELLRSLAEGRVPSPGRSR